jgi:glucose/arabinose dehydrogenase
VRGSHSGRSRVFRFAGATCAAALALTAQPSAARAATLPAGFTENVVASGFDGPTAFAFLPDGRLLVAEKGGLVRLVKNGDVQDRPFLDLRTRVNSFEARGVLDVAVDPGFASNGHVYVYYTYEHDASNPSGNKTGRLSRFAATGDTAAASTEVVVLGKRNGNGCNALPAGADCLPHEQSHYGGSILFPPEGTIWLTTGDGNTGSAVGNDALRSQRLDSLAGKVLRVTKSGAGLPTNPFWNGDAGANRSKVWAYGLRNPFRANLRPGTNTAYIGDVGWNSWEEINVTRKGANFGWPCYEGNGQQAGYASKQLCKDLYVQGLQAIRFPLTIYARSATGASVTGGAFYTGSSYPSQYRGAYFFGDYVKGFLRSLRVDADDALVTGPTTVATEVGSVVDIGGGPNGDLHYIRIGRGLLLRIRFTSGNSEPTAEATADPTNGGVPLIVQFSGSGSHDPDGEGLTYRWTFGDGTPSSSVVNPTHTYQASGTYTATLTVSDGRGGTSSDAVTVTAGNHAPKAAISSPAPTVRYKVGDVIALTGSATDVEDGSLPGARLTWVVTISHCPGGSCHTHPLTTLTGANASFTIPDHGDDTRVRIVLTAEDSGGLKGTVARTIHPRTVEITLTTHPQGQTVVYDGESGTAPLTRTTIVGSTHAISAPSPQGDYRFACWSDGGSQQHDVMLGRRDAVYKATLIGSWQAAPIVGSRGRDTLSGTPGDDVICAFQGADVIQGKGGRDLIFGHGSDDRIYGGRGRDELFGEGGDDQLFGGNRRDALYGGRGRDFLHARDGFKDRVDGGLGRDTAVIDAHDLTVSVRTIF